jgi:hypothetical protein
MSSIMGVGCFQGREMAAFRMIGMLSVAEKTRRLVQERGLTIEQLRAIDAVVALPLLDGASLEATDQVQIGISPNAMRSHLVVAVVGSVPLFAPVSCTGAAVPALERARNDVAGLPLTLNRVRVLLNAGDC